MSTSTDLFNTLRESTEPTWTSAVTHRFTTSLFDSSLPDSVLSRYLIQDYRFADAFVALIGSAIASADLYSSRVRFGRFAGMVCSDEDTYFLRSFSELGVSESARSEVHTPDAGPTAGFKALMREAADTRSYPVILAVLCVAEGLYLDWAQRAPKPLPERFVHREWIVLHDNDFFRDFVGFLKAELDRVGREDEGRVRDFFERAVRLELEFFDAAYDGEP